MDHHSPPLAPPTSPSSSSYSNSSPPTTEGEPMDKVIDFLNEEGVNFDHPMQDLNEVVAIVYGMTNIGMSLEMQILNHVRQELDKRQQICVVVLLCYVVHAIHMLEMMSKYTHSPISYINEEKDRRSVQLMTQLVQTEKCRDIIRMGPEAFMQLCEKLRSSGRVKDSTRAIVEEQVANFLHIIGHNVKNRTASFFFHRSRETVSRHFQNVLRAIISLEQEFFVQPSDTDVPPALLNNSKFYPFFKDCIGAIDGTHIRVKVPRADAPRFCGRKDYPTQNVFAACNFDMRFTYVLAGWEGSASDSRILEDALTREDSLKILEGKFYIGDAGFMLKRGVLTPYRHVRYHLKEYSARGPQNAKELFNLRHSSLRNVIERTCGVVKKRFPILSGGCEPYYSVQIMSNIVLACCILHNFLMGVDIDEEIIAQVDRELLQTDIDRSTSQQRDEDYRQGANLRDNIALEMWNAYDM